MIVVIDADYDESTHRGHVAGIICETPLDDEISGVVTAEVEDIQEYCPGQFYKRELQCVEAILSQLDPEKVDLIIVDGYADFGTEERSLGAHVFEEYHIPVIGIAKTHYALCFIDNTEVLRGTSLKPLFVTCKGIDHEQAKSIVAGMAGENRLPYLVKLADKYARDWCVTGCVTGDGSF
ncbi:MAG: endonuclease V [Mogibacterium sp.]|nr:endonuclease V [Mogibacterium sp.]